MKLYLAGIYTSNFNLKGSVYQKLTDAERKYRDEIEYFLESYHYIFRQSYVDKLRDDGVKVFLDSGAFSAFTKGVKVNLPEYCEYIKRNSDVIDVASVLDGIGDPLETWRNQLWMEELGTRPLPCFHYGEDERYLEWYIARYEYITLGGMVPISTPQLVHWLDRIWEKYLCDASGNPRLKVHGFGLTSLPLMKRYPWYSVDSSTWVQWSANGMILIPGIGQINVSSKSSSRKIEGQHLRTYAESQREAIEERIIELGFDPERLANEYAARWVFNIWAFPEEGKKSTLKQFKRPQPELW